MADTSSQFSVFKKKVWQDAIGFKRGDMMFDRAARQLVGMALAYGAAWYIFDQQIALAVLAGGLMGANKSISGPSHMRSRLLLAMSFTLSTSVALAIGLSFSPLLGALVATALSFVLTVVGSADTSYRAVTLSTVSYVVVYASLGIEPEKWWQYGAAMLAGGLWQWVFLSFIWPVKQFQPERIQISDLYRELAHGLEALPDLKQAELILFQSSDLADMQQIAGDKFPKRWQDEKQAVVHLFDRAFVLDAALVGLSREALKWRDTPREPEVDAVLDQVVELLYNLSRHMREGEGHPSERDWAQWRYLPAQAAAVSEQFGQAMDTVFLALRQLEGDKDDTQPVRLKPYQNFWQELRGPLHDRKSLAFAAFYAGSIGVLLYIAHWLSREHGIDNAYWLVMTYSLIMSSDYQRLLTRGVARIAGTLTGVVFIAAVTWLLGDTTEVSTLLLALAVYLAMAGLNAGYAPLTFGFTVYALAVGDSAGMSGAAWERIFLTLGGVAAAYALYRLWPNWENNALMNKLQEGAQELQELLQSCRAWAQGEAGEKDGGPPKQARENLLRLGQTYSSAKALVTGGRLEPQHAAGGRGKINPKDAQELLERLECQVTHAVTLYGELATRSRPQGAIASELEQVLQEAKRTEQRAASYSGVNAQ